jgi:hypothetical protein
MTLATSTIAFTSVRGLGDAGRLQEKAACEHCMHHQDQHTKEVNDRGDRVMGFHHMATTHHFTLLRDGGSIEVQANEQTDTASIEQIRAHLREISKAFAGGDFSMPMAIHDQTPPGADVMKELRSVIAYSFEETAKGGRVRMTSSDAKAVGAIHEFLRFQIQEHKTGDSLEVGDHKDGR